MPAFELATSSLIVQFARRGLGVGCVVRDFAQAALDAGEVVEVQTDPPVPPRRFLLAARGAPASRAAEALLRLLAP